MANIVKTVYVVDITQAKAAAKEVEQTYARLDRQTSVPLGGGGGGGVPPNDPPSRNTRLKPSVKAQRKRDEILDAEAERITDELAGVLAASRPTLPKANYNAIFNKVAIITAGQIALIYKGIEASAQLEKRQRELNAVNSSLTKGYGDLGETINTYAKYSSLGAEASQKLTIAAVRAVDGTATSAKELQRSLLDIAAFKGLDIGVVAQETEELSKGNASVVLSGKNAASVLDIYAASLGRTADSLTLSEKQQALFNEVLDQGALNLGADADKLNSADSAMAKLKDTTTGFLAKIGELSSPGVVAFLKFLQNPNIKDVGTFLANTNSFGLGGAQPDLTDAINRDLTQQQEQLKKQEAFLKKYKENQELLAKARETPNANLTTFSLSKFADLRGFDQKSLESQNEVIKAAVAEGKTYVENFKKSINGALERGDLVELKNFRTSFQDVYKNLVSFEDYKSISQRLNKAISEQIDKGVEKAKELGKAFKTTFEDLAANSTDNPFVRIFSSAKREMDQLRERIKGLSPDLKKVFEDQLRIQNQQKLFETRLDTNIQSNDLSYRASQFRNYNPSLSVEKQLETLQRQREDDLNSASDPQYYEDREKYILGTGQREQQKRLDDQIDLLKRSNPRNQEELAVVNQRLISLLGSADPSSLSKDQRDTVAMALQKESERRAQAETAAYRVAEQSAVTLKQIAQYQQDLVNIALKQGIKGIEARINVVDGTSNGLQVKQTSRPTPEDTADFYRGELGLNSIGGS